MWKHSAFKECNYFKNDFFNLIKHEAEEDTSFIMFKLVNILNANPDGDSISEHDKLEMVINMPRIIKIDSFSSNP